VPIPPPLQAEAPSDTTLHELQTRVRSRATYTDYPYPWTRTAIDLILETPGLSDDDRIAMLGGTAAKLLGISS
jgi:hypothetical protein